MVQITHHTHVTQVLARCLKLNNLKELSHVSIVPFFNTDKIRTMFWRKLELPWLNVMVRCRAWTQSHWLDKYRSFRRSACINHNKFIRLLKKSMKCASHQRKHNTPPLTELILQIQKVAMNQISVSWFFCILTCSSTLLSILLSKNINLNFYVHIKSLLT